MVKRKIEREFDINSDLINFENNLLADFVYEASLRTDDTRKISVNIAIEYELDEKYDKWLHAVNGHIWRWETEKEEADRELYLRNVRSARHAAIVYLHERCGIQQKEIAKMLGLSQGAISNIYAKGNSPWLRRSDFLRLLPVDDKTIGDETIDEQSLLG